MATGGEDDERDMEDPLLRLPRELFISILSLLPTEEVVRMACLSKAWRDLDITNLILPSLPVLMFDCYQCNYGCRESLAKAIEGSLKLGPKQVISLEKLRIRFDTWMESPSLSIDSWIGAAFERKVTELDLNFIGDMFYDFPAEIFTANSSLAVLRLSSFRLGPKVFTTAAATTITVLSLSHCCFSGIWGDINLPALRSLSLLDTDESFQKLISGCPSLETLSIRQLALGGDYPSGKFKIFGPPRLRRLDMFDCSIWGGMEIDASSLEYLRCDYLWLYPHEMVFSHCESLKELLLIDFRISEDFIQDLGSTLPNLEKLHLCDCETDRIGISHPNLKQFEVRYCTFDMEVDIKIDAPNLRSFLYQGFSLALVPVMSSMKTSSLQEVSIDVVDLHSYDHLFIRQLKKFFEKLKHCKVITLVIKSKDDIIIPRDEWLTSSPPIYDIKHLNIMLAGCPDAYIMDRMLWTCRPQTLSITFADTWDDNCFVKLLYMKFMEKEKHFKYCTSCPVRCCWLRYLDDAQIDGHDSKLAIDRILAQQGRSMTQDHTLPLINKWKVQFTLKWRSCPR